MRRRGSLTVLAGAAAGALALAGPASGADVEDTLARMRGALEPATTMRAQFTLAIANPGGHVVQWSGVYTRRGGPDARLRMEFESPADLAGTVVTVARAKDGSSLPRIYLPALRRVRTLDADMRGESFLGTDFNYEDLGLTQLDFEKHSLGEQDELDGRTCRELVSQPTEGWWYGKIERCIDGKTGLPVRAEYYDRNGTLWKVGTIDRIETIGGHATPMQWTIRTIPTDTWTRLTLTNVAYGVEVPDAIFDLHPTTTTASSAPSS